MKRSTFASTKLSDNQRISELMATLCLHSLTGSVWSSHGQTNFSPRAGATWVCGTTGISPPLPQHTVTDYHDMTCLFPIETFHFSRYSTTQQSPLHMAPSVSADGVCPGAGASPLPSAEAGEMLQVQKTRLGTDQRGSLCGRLYSAHALTRSHKITKSSAVNCRQ